MPHKFRLAKSFSSCFRPLQYCAALFAAPCLVCALIALAISGRRDCKNGACLTALTNARFLASDKLVAASCAWLAAACSMRFLAAARTCCNCATTSGPAPVNDGSGVLTEHLAHRARA